MKESERSEFDEQWKGAFEEAEVSPAAAVWSNLDRELTLAEGNEIKKRMIFYQRLAAACVLFALMAGSFSVYHWQQNDKIAQANSNAKSNNEIKIEQQPNKNVTSVDENSEIKNNASSENKISSDQKLKTSGSSDQNVQASSKTVGKSLDEKKEWIALNDDRNQKIANDEAKNDNGVQVSALAEKKQNKNNIDWLATNENVDLSLLPIDSLHGGPTFADIVRKLPAIPAAFMAERKRKNFNHEKVWASVVAAAGTYSDNNKGGSPYSVNSTSSASTLPTGNSYSVGVLGGVRVAKRWVLQSGVQYMNQSAGYSSDVSSPSLNAAANLANNKSLYSYTPYSGSSYDITSTNQFVSVPVQAGYLFIDRKIGWQVNSGVATDFFVRNTLSDPSGQRQSYSQGAGSDSPYRSVNFAGLMSSEVSYKVGKNYRVSLVPGFKYSFNPVLKSQATGNPFVWDVGFRFRYIFR